MTRAAIKPRPTPSAALLRCATCGATRADWTRCSDPDCAKSFELAAYQKPRQPQ